MRRAADEQAIDSPQNPAVKRARALRNDRALREREGVYVAWGLHLAQEALRTRAALRTVFAGPRLRENPEGREVLRALQATGIAQQSVSTRVLESIAPGSGDQGVLLLCVRPTTGAAAVLRPGATLVLAAHGVQDPGNLGSMIRSSLAFGASGLIALPGCADPFGDRAVRAAMGAQFSLLLTGADVPSFLALQRAAGLQLVAADPAGDAIPDRVNLKAPTVILLGSEGAGLPDGLLEAADRRVRIPLAPGVESLNVHAAAAALLYETARQRGFSVPS